MSGFNPKWIIGRTIVAVDMRPWDPGAGYLGMNHDPLITLDNGATIRFVAEEAVDDYGVDILYRPPPGTP